MTSSPINIKSSSQLVIETQKYTAYGPINVLSGGQLLVAGSPTTTSSDISIGYLSGGGQVLLSALFTTVAEAQGICMASFLLRDLISSEKIFTHIFVTDVHFITSASARATFRAQTIACSFNIGVGTSADFMAATIGSTFLINGTATLSGPATHTGASFFVIPGASLLVASNVQNAVFTLSGGSVTISGSCTNCTFSIRFYVLSFTICTFSFSSFSSFLFCLLLFF